MSFEAYSVAIRLRLVDSVSSGLVAMAGQFAAFNRHVSTSKTELKALEGQLQRIKLMGVVGAAAMGIGAMGLYALSGPLKAARDYELAFTKFKTLNLGETVNKQADQFARSADIVGVSATQLMKTMAESVGIFGSYGEAQKYVPRLAALNTANSAIFHGKINEIDEGSTRAIIKFMDRRGLTKDEAGFNRGLDLAERIVSGSGGFIQFRDLDQFSKQGGTAFRALSDEGLTNMALLLQEQGGSRAGTAMMSIYQNLVAGRTPKKTMALLQAFGFGHINEVHSGTIGGKSSTSATFSLNPKYAEMLSQDPVGFFRSVFLPQLAAHGITSESAILKTTNDLLSNRTASNQASIMTTQLMQIARDAALTRNAMGVDQVTAAYKNDPNSKFGNLSAKYTNLMLELGEAALPMVTKAVGGLITIVRGLTTFAHNFPTVTKILVVAFTGLSALEVAGGAIKQITAGFKGLGLALAVSKGVGLGGMLLETAGGLGAVAMAASRFLGAAGLVGAAGGVGYLAGSLLNKAGPGGDLGGYLAGKMYEFVHPYSAKPVVVHTQLNVDGKKMAEVTTKHQASSANSPRTGISSFDGRQAIIPAGF